MQIVHSAALTAADRPSITPLTTRARRSQPPGEAPHASGRSKRHARRQQALDQRAHGGDALAERQRARAAEEQALVDLAAQRGGQSLVDAELAPARQAVAQAALRQAVESQRAA